MRGSLQIGQERDPRYGECVRIANDVAELLVTLEYGPRIIHYALTGEPNVFFVNRDPEYRKRGSDFDSAFYPGAFWDIRGGNRLWVAPHSYPSAFYPDNGPVAWEPIDGGARFMPAPRGESGLRLSTEVRLREASSRATISHRVVNENREPRIMAAWSITSLAPGGIELASLPRRQSGVLPNRRLSLWPYTDVRDPRLTIGNRYVALTHDPEAASSIKIGLGNEDGLACYLNNGFLFVLGYVHEKDAEYADFGVSYETFADGRMVEMESMSTLRNVQPGGSVQHEEVWRLLRCEKRIDPSDEVGTAAFLDSLL